MECATLWWIQFGKMYIDLDDYILLSVIFYRALLNLHPTFIQDYRFSETFVFSNQNFY